MALSKKTKEILTVAMANAKASAELAAAIESGSNTPAATVAAFGTTTNLTGVNGTGNNAADLVTTEARLDAIESKINAILASIKAARQMS